MALSRVLARTSTRTFTKHSSQLSSARRPIFRALCPRLASGPWTLTWVDFNDVIPTRSAVEGPCVLPHRKGSPSPGRLLIPINQHKGCPILVAPFATRVGGKISIRIRFQRRHPDRTEARLTRLRRLVILSQPKQRVPHSCRALCDKSGRRNSQARNAPPCGCSADAIAREI